MSGADVKQSLRSVATASNRLSGGMPRIRKTVFSNPGKLVSHNNTSFPGLLKTVFRILGMPPLNLFDAVATDLSDCFTSAPDMRPYSALPEDPSVFDQARARE